MNEAKEQRTPIDARPVDADVRRDEAWMRKEIVRLIELLVDVEDLASWHCDDNADPNDDSPDDNVAHINGLIVQVCRRRNAPE